MDLYFLKRSEINVELWNKKIDEAQNGTIYAYTWHLDILSYNWEAIVSNDYNYIMPIAFGKKYGIKYAYSPYLSKLTGIFSKEVINSQVTSKFTKLLIKKYKYLNCFVDFSSNELKQIVKTNYTLNLSFPYSELYSHFNNDVKRNLKKMTKNKIHLIENISIKDFMNFYKLEKKYYTEKDKDLKTENYIAYCIKNKISEVIGIKNEKNELISVAFFTFSQNRIYYTIGVTNNEGKKLGASYKIIDYIIKKHSNNNLIFDFDGSNIPSIAYYFSGWGAKPEIYYYMKINNLPFPIRLIKK